MIIRSTVQHLWSHDRGTARKPEPKLAECARPITDGGTMKGASVRNTNTKYKFKIQIQNTGTKYEYNIAHTKIQKHKIQVAE